MEKTILHCDMNNCFASIETKMNPRLRNKPIAVGGDRKKRHGIVLAKSQEAKAFGVQTGEAIWQAKIKCPELIIVPPHYEAYLKHSKMAKEIYYEYTNQVESFGLDEAWLDVTNSSMLYGSGEQIAETLRRRIKQELGITISIGLSFNKTFAKLGSDMKKPDAITVIRREDFRSIVWPLAVDELIGIGKASKKKLERLNIYSLGDLAKADPELLRKKLGINGYYFWQMANGNDYSPVHDIDYLFPVKSIGQGTTFIRDLTNNQQVKHGFQMLALKVTKRLIESGYRAGGLSISIRNCDLQTISLQSQFAYPTMSSIIFVEYAMDLFKAHYKWDRTIRSLRIKAIQLIDAKQAIQLQIVKNYSDFEKKEAIDQTIYEIKKKFGDDAISFAGMSANDKIPKRLNEVISLPNMYKEKQIDKDY